MTLTEIVEFLKRKIVLPAATTTALLAGGLIGEARADGMESDLYKPSKQKTTTKISLNQAIDGYARSELFYGNLEQGFFEDANLTLKLTPDLLVTFDELYSNVFFPKAKMNAECKRMTAGIGGYPQKNENETFLRALAGYEWADFTNSIRVNADKFIAGAQLGYANRTNGTRTLLTVLGGIGKTDYELQSGYSDNGELRSFFMGVEASKRLASAGKKQQIGNSFDTNYAAEEHKNSLYLALDTFVQWTKYAKLSNETGGGARLSLPYILNLRDYAKDENGNMIARGTMYKITPFLEYQGCQSTTDLSRRMSNLNRGTLGLRIEAELTTWAGIAGEFGYQFTRIDENDPGQGISVRDDKHGTTGKLTLYFKF